jgi:hypothetical protein
VVTTPAETDSVLARLSRARGSVTWRIAVKAGPHLFVAAVVPTVCFLVGRDLWGLGGAICLALGWNAACQATRRLRGYDWSGLLVIGSITLGLRAMAALALNSARIYFLAPAVITAIMGAVYIGTALGSKPLLNRVAGDLIPTSVLDTEDPRIWTLLRVSSVIYGAEQMVSALVSIVMVENMSTTSYVALHEMASCALLGLVFAITVPFLLGPTRAALRPQLALGA